MSYREFTPSTILRPYVQLIWSMELDGPIDFGPPERIAPDGIVELVLHYREPVAVRYAGEDFERPPRSSVVSQTRRYIEIVPTGPTGFVSVRFLPWGAYHLLAHPVSAFRDRVIAAADLWTGVTELEDRVAAAPDVERRVSLVERFLIERLRRHHKQDVEPLLRAVWEAGGRVRIARFCRELGLTERTAERTFGAVVGMPPKSFARLVRFLRTCAAIRRGGWETLTEVAHDRGYYDQAHLIGDFRSFAGMTPREFATGGGLSFLELE